MGRILSFPEGENSSNRESVESECFDEEMVFRPKLQNEITDGSICMNIWYFYN